MNPNTFRNLFFFTILMGGVALVYALFFPGANYQIFVSSLFTDTIAVPFAGLKLAGLDLSIHVDNYLIFQEFKVLAPIARNQESLIFGLVFCLIATSALAFSTSFRKWYFVISGVLWILLLTLSNLNGLDIIAPSSNYSLIIILLGCFLPTILIYIWGQNLAYFKKWLIIFLGFTVTGITLFQLSPILQPELFISYHVLVPAIGFSLIWLIASGHAVISGVYILLTRANQSIGTRISIQLTIIGLIYLGVLFATLLRLTGEQNLPIPTFNPIYLIGLIGVFGWITIKIKSETNPEMADSSRVIQGIYLLGFALVLWTIWKVEMDSNEPAIELIKHLLVYSQIAFSIFFFVYLFSNFLSIMDSGKALDRVIFKPYSLPYYHVRIGGLIGLMLLTIFADGIIGVQVNSLSNNILGDYYYGSNQKLEASILYENSWTRYRKNGKAKQSVAQLLFELNQPTLAKQHLEESFVENPQIDNILLLADRLHLENKIFEAVYYLENGLKRFPQSAEIANNLALFYTKIGRNKDAEEALSQFYDPVSKGNKLALQLKKKSSIPELNPVTLIERVNAIPATKIKGLPLDNSTKESLLEEVMEVQNPILIESTLRNIFTESSYLNTDEELNLVDSLSREETYADYITSLQETASLRSLAANRIAESIKNLKGLAFRSPGDAAYYLQLSSSILAVQLDFKKSAQDLLAALEKGFQNIDSHHLDILLLAEKEQEADSLMLSYGLKGNSLKQNSVMIWKDFHELIPQDSFARWENLASGADKNQFGKRLIMHKSHGLTKNQINRISATFSDVVAGEINFQNFISNPDFTEESQIKSFMAWLELGDELSANPYFTPLILAAADRLADPLAQYELLNAASEFNRDPILWIQKVNAARKIGLTNYATAALEEMKNWVEEDKLLQLQLTNL